MTTMSKDERADLRARIDATLKAAIEGERLQVWDEANRRWREHVKLLEVDMGQRPYYPADQATYVLQIHELLRQLYQADDAIAFLQTPQVFLKGEIPARVIARGDGQRVLDFLQGTVDGVYL